MGNLVQDGMQDQDGGHYYGWGLWEEKKERKRGKSAQVLSK